MKKKIHPKSLESSQLALPKLTPEEEQELDYYICCSIEELENVLIRNSTEKQKKLAKVSLKILRNPKEAYLKKRQVMRQHFGDYKKTFEGKREEVASNLIDNKLYFKSVNIPNDSLFIQRHKHRVNINHQCNLEGMNKQFELSDHTKKIKGTEMGKKCALSFKPSDNSFKFNF